MVVLLDGEARRELFDIYDIEFESALPHPEQANIVAVKNGDDIEAIVTAETLIRADMWWIRPDLRNTAKGATHIRRLYHYMRKNIPAGSSVITLAASDTQKKIFEHIGMRYVPGDVYRLDL